LDVFCSIEIEAFPTDSWISLEFSLVSVVVMVGSVLFWIKTKTLDYMTYMVYILLLLLDLH